MTLIIGLKLKDCILLIGDRKVSNGTDRPSYTDKIEAPLEGARFAVGAAGLQDLSKEFNRKIANQVNSRNAEVRLLNMAALNGTGISIEEVEEGKKSILLPYIYDAEHFLDDCSMIIRKLSEIGKEIEPNPIEALVAVNTNKSSLYKIFHNGHKQEGDRFAVGSGAVHIQEFLNQLDMEKISIGNAIYAGVFFIKYIEMMCLDDGVGVENDRLPQVFIVNDSFAKEYGSNKKEDIDFILKSVNKRIKRIQKNFTFGKE